jgi:hypothetical protein
MKALRNAPPGKEFVFRLPNGTEIGKAKNVVELAQVIRDAPLASLVFHAKGKHFAPWLEMIGERDVAARIKGTEFNDQTVRVALLRCLR